MVDAESPGAECPDVDVVSLPAPSSQRIGDQTAAAGLLAAVGELVPSWQANADPPEDEDRFPLSELRDLHRLGAYDAPVPARFGGLGLGTEPSGALYLLDLLRLIGRANLSLGRVFEGHVNALALVSAYGTELQARRAALDAAAGHLFAIWNTEADGGLRLIGTPPAARLRGGKTFCSAAGYAARALVTARRSGKEASMLLLPLEPSQGVAGGAAPMQGMRASVTASMRFDGMPVATSAVIGSPGDYLREPLFSAGAWRTSAVTLGGIEGLLTETRKQLVMRGRENSPHQKARVGRAIIAEESARLWLRKAAIVAESRRQAPDDAVGYVNLARTAVETAAREIITLVQRSLGLACLLQANPVERRLRDLTTYLRQPAPDAALENGAARFMQRPLPDG